MEKESERSEISDLSKSEISLKVKSKESTLLKKK